MQMNTWIKTDGGLRASRFKSKAKRADCVVRAISIATQKPYEEVFDELLDLSKQTGFFPNADQTWELYIKNLGWNKNKPQRNQRGDLIRLVKFNSLNKTSIVKTRIHLVTIKHNVIMDAFDNKYSIAYSYYTKSLN